jgi:hypothetical protein
MKEVTLIKMCLNETDGTVCVGKHLSDMFPNKNGLKKEDALSPLFFNVVLDDAISRVQVNKVGLKLNGTHQLLFYADDANILGGRVHTIKKNTNILAVACKETGLEVNSNTGYVVTSQDQNACRSHNIKTHNYISFEMAERFKYWGTILTNQNSIQEKIKSRLKSGNACYHSAQNFLSSNLLSKNIKI